MCDQGVVRDLVYGRNFSLILYLFWEQHIVVVPSSVIVLGRIHFSEFKYTVLIRGSTGCHFELWYAFPVP